MSRSEKHSWWIDAQREFGDVYTGECGCKHCTRTKAWIKRQEHKAARRKTRAVIQFDLAADEAFCPYIPECGCQD